ncbi:MAG: CotS family spore coat protein [Chitinophagales bacterium]
MANDAGAWSVRDLRPVLAEYGLDIQGVAPVRKAWRIETEAGPRFLKMSTLTLPELSFVSAALAHLRRQGGEAIPRLYPTYQGRLWVEQRGRRFTLTDWYEGRELDFESPLELEAAILTLSRLHRWGEGFQAPPEGRLRVEWGRWPEKFGRRVTHFEWYRREAEADGSRFAREYAALLPAYLHQAKWALELLERSAYPKLSATRLARPVICHHDLSDRNFLVTGGAPEEAGKAAPACAPLRARLVDFDYCLHDLRVHDLANLIQRYTFMMGCDVSAAERALATYDRLNPLSRDELRLLVALMAWPHRFWLLGWQRWQERLPWSEQRWLDAVEKRAEELAERERFLSALAVDLGLGTRERRPG